MSQGLSGAAAAAAGLAGYGSPTGTASEPSSMSTSHCSDTESMSSDIENQADTQSSAQDASPAPSLPKAGPLFPGPKTSFAERGEPFTFSQVSLSLQGSPHYMVIMPGSSPKLLSIRFLGYSSSLMSTKCHSICKELYICWDATTTALGLFCAPDMTP